MASRPTIEAKPAVDIPETIRAYAAGFVDGEGYIGIRPPSSTPRAGGSAGYLLIVTIVNHDKRPLAMLYKYFGGHIYNRRMKGNCKPQFEYQVTGASGQKMLLCILPYLESKKEQALLATEWWGGKNHENIGIKLPPEEVERNLIYYERLKSLNHRGLA